MRHYFLKNNLIIALCLISTIGWQSCEPLDVVDCTGNNGVLLSSSASITFQDQNNSTTFRVHAPITCDQTLNNEYSCNSVDVTIEVIYKDNQGDPMGSVSKLIQFYGGGLGPADWTLDSTGGVVVGDGSVIFSMGTASYPDPVKSIDVKVHSFFTDAVSCLDEGGSSTVAINSLNFWGLTGQTVTKYETISTFFTMQHVQTQTFTDAVVY